MEHVMAASNSGFCHYSPVLFLDITMGQNLYRRSKKKSIIIDRDWIFFVDLA